MDKKLAGLLGAVAGLATAATAQAAIEPAQTAPEALHASSYADLLAPVPNAVEALKADDAARAQDFELAQTYYTYQYPPPSGYYTYHPYYRYHHHHHHHHHAYRHHHHHHGTFVGVPGVGGVVIGH